MDTNNNGYKKTVIIYGNPKDSLDNCLGENDCRYILLEPRKQHIDYIRNSAFNSAVTLIPKALIGENTLKELPLSTILPVGYTSTTQKSFCTSIYNLVVSYGIESIHELLINIETKNITDVLENAKPFVNIIQKITFAQDIPLPSPQGTVLSSFVQEDASFIKKHSDKKILVMFPPQHQHSLTVNFTRFKSFVKQYNLYYMDTSGEFIPPQEIDVSLTHSNSKTVTSQHIFPQMLVEKLNMYFEHSSEKDFVVDYIILFNNAYLSSNHTLSIDMDLPETQIRVHRRFDIIYATKNCWYNIYQILRSKAFCEYMDEKSLGKGVLVKILCKRWMWEYLGKMFDVKMID